MMDNAIRLDPRRLAKTIRLDGFGHLRIDPHHDVDWRHGGFDTLQDDLLSPEVVHECAFPDRLAAAQGEVTIRDGPVPNL